MTNSLPKLLITGASGQLASALQTHPLTKRYTLIPCSHVQMDLTQLSAIQQRLTQWQPQLVINTAAFTAVDKAESERQLAMAVNYLGAANLATVCEKHHVPLLHISTDYVFDGNKTTPYTETDMTSPINIYGQSKRMGEEAIKEQCRYHLILRVSGIVSEFGNNFLKTILRLANEKEELRVVMDQITCPTDAHDIAQTIYFLADRMLATKTWQPGIYHYCSEQPTSWYDFAAAIINTANRRQPLKVKQIRPISAQNYPTPARRPAYSAMDCHKIKNEFDILQPNWQQGIQRIITAS